MKTLLQTMAAVMLAATMVPAYAERSTYRGADEFDLYDGRGESQETVDSTAAWAHGVIRATTVCGSLCIGTMMALSGYPIAFLGGLASSCIWASAMDRLAYWYGMNEATREKAQYINNAIADGALWTIAICALGMAMHKKTATVA